MASILDFLTQLEQHPVGILLVVALWVAFWLIDTYRNDLARLAREKWQARDILVFLGTVVMVVMAFCPPWEQNNVHPPCQHE